MRPALILSTWKRLDYLPVLLEILGKQNYPAFDVYLWNDNVEERQWVEAIVAQFPVLDIHLCHARARTGPMGRHFYAASLADFYPAIIFVDDDQVPEPGFIRACVEHFQPKSYVSQWGWLVYGDYWQRLRVRGGKPCNFCGPGGSIIDSSIYASLPAWQAIEAHDWMLDDVVISAHALTQGFALRGVTLPIVWQPDLHSDHHALYKTLRREKVVAFDRLIRKRGLHTLPFKGGKITLLCYLYRAYSQRLCVQLIRTCKVKKIITLIAQKR